MDGLTKVNNWIEVWLTGLDKIKVGTEVMDFDLKDEFYDFEKNKFKKCRIGKDQTCAYPFFIGIVEGVFDLTCWDKMLLNNYPKVTV